MNINIYLNTQKLIEQISEDILNPQELTQKILECTLMLMKLPKKYTKMFGMNICGVFYLNIQINVLKTEIGQNRPIFVLFGQNGSRLVKGGKICYKLHNLVN